MTDLVTLADYKEYIGISNVEEDVKLTTIISSVSSLVRTYCARNFIDFFGSDKTEIISVDYDSRYVPLSEYPIVSITSVEERPSYNEAYATLTTGDFEYYLDTTTDSLVRTTGDGAAVNWAKGPGAVKVVYKAGFSAVPADLQLAVYDLITYYHKKEYRGAKTLRGASSSIPSTTTQGRNVSFPDHIKRVLDLYKSV